MALLEFHQLGTLAAISCPRKQKSRVSGENLMRPGLGGIKLLAKGEKKIKKPARNLRIIFH